MEKNLYIDASHPNETRIVLKSNNSIEEYEFEDKNNLNFKNNIYLATVSRVEPSLQAAFVNFGRERHGFLAFNDIQSDYYQIPSEDKEKLRIAEEKIRENLKDKASEIIQESNQTETTQETNGEKVKDENLGENKKKDYREEVKTSFGIKRYRIQEVIKPGQVILIQVIKEERGQKGAALTTFISLAGKYMVLMPNTPKGGGISRKIYNSSDRQKIRNILNEIDIPKIRRDSLLTSTLLYFSNINELAKKPKEAEIKSGVDLKLKVHTTGLSRKKIIKSDVNDLCILKNLQVFKKPNVKKI